MLASAEDLTHRYGDRTVYEDLTFSLRPGVTALVGVNGAGKTTLMKTMATLLEPTQGHFVLDSDADSSGTSRKKSLVDRRRRTALMPQSLSAPAGVRVTDFLSYVGWLRDVPRSARRARVLEVLSEVGLTDRAHSKLSSLSGGMLRRVNLAQALMAGPDLLLLDEPTEGLDPEQRIRIRELIERCGRRAIVLMSSHLIEDVVHIADRILVLNGGAIVFDGSREELSSHASETSYRDLSVHEAAFLELTRGA